MNICVLFQYQIFETNINTFFRNQYFPTYTKIFPKPIPILFSIPKEIRNRYQYFYRYQKISKPIPIRLSKPKFFKTDTDTFFRYQKNRNRYQYFYRYQNFSKPIPILSKNIEKFLNRYRYFYRYQKILKLIPSKNIEKF